MSSLVRQGLRRQFLEDNSQRKARLSSGAASEEALERLYSIFDGMVPKYVIPRMLLQARA